MTALGVAMAVIAALWLLAAMLARPPGPEFTLERLSEGSTINDVTVIVPARNEQINIAACLGSLMAQRVREIIVVDDRSEDDTGTIARELATRDPRIRVVAGADPPDGWAGKVNALVTGVRNSDPETEWILFVDADVMLGAGAVRSAISRAQRDQLDLLSLWGRWSMPSFGVRLLQPVIGAVVRAAAQIERVNDPEAPEAFANGQFVLVRREAYQEVGGWEVVRDRILEDVAFARKCKAAGLATGMYYGKKVMTVVPYRSLPELWNGYRKNLVEGAGGVAPLFVLTALVLVFSVLPFVIAPWLLGEYFYGRINAFPATAGLLACLMAMAFRWSTAGMFDHPRSDAVWHPIANLLFAALLVHAGVTSLLGLRVPWKGRTLDK